MDSRRTENFKLKLLKERDEIVDVIEYENGNGADDLFQDYYNELSVYDNHPADMGTETFEAEMRLNLRSYDKRLLNEIDNALSKFDNGSYGYCEGCGNEIENERLEVLPSTRFCINCKDGDYPVTGKIDTRPVEEDVLKYPYSRSFNDSKDKTGFDGEDSWQAVARYNKTALNKMALDWYDNNMYDDTISGVTEDIDDLSNEYYENQIDDTDYKSDKKK